MAHSDKIKELYSFVVSTRYFGYLDIYISVLSYIYVSCKCPIYRPLRHIYPRYIGYLRAMFSLSTVPV